MRAFQRAAACLLLLAASAAGTAAPVKSVVLFVGDSLTAGYGISSQEAWPALVGREWRRRELPFVARNAGVSGGTTAGALENIDWNLTEDVGILFLCIGANDGLRGLSLAQSRRNISSIIEAARKSGARVVLAGMKLPPNYGPAYTRSFESMYREVARKHGLKFMPFLLEGVAARSRYNLEDGVHPNAEGHRRIAGSVLAFFDKEGLLK